MIDDFELLRRFTGKHSEEAFAELVRRHINLVYHAALRQTRGNATLAEEVSQTVFTDLARKAGSLLRRPGIVGWLYTSTRFAAAKANRTEQRRQAREHAAYVMQELTPESTPGADWERLRPLIDAVLGELAERDRDAVLLRFFEGRSFSEVGAQLAMNEDTARVCVARALDRMQGGLARRGVTSTAIAVAGVLASQAGVAAPAGLASQVTAQALVGGSVGAAGLTTIFMTTSKLNLGIVAAVFALCGMALIWQRQANERQLREFQRETVRLQGQVESLRAESRENAGLRQEIADLRRTVLKLQAAGSQLAAASTAAPVTSSADAVGKKSREAWRNVGRATPADAYETVMWACDRGELDVLVDAFVLSKAQKAETEEIFQRLPEKSRAEFGTAKKMLALLFASGTPAAIQPIAEFAKGSEDFLVRARVWNDRGQSNELELPFHRDADGWRVMVPDWQMKKSLAKLK